MANLPNSNSIYSSLVSISCGKDGGPGNGGIIGMGGGNAPAISASTTVCAVDNHGGNGTASAVTSAVLSLTENGASTAQQMALLEQNRRLRQPMAKK